MKKFLVVAVVLVLGATIVGGAVVIPGYTSNVCEPGGTLNVSELLENPVYDIEGKIYGKVSLLGEVFCPCFELTSGGEKVLVWYGLMVEDDGTERPSVSVEGIENGDWVIVTGELKSEGEYRALNDFWASNIEKAVSVNASHAGEEVIVAVGGLLIVTLESNLTTGFMWTLEENSDESVLQEVGHEYVAAETTEPPMPGTGGEELWTFQALKEGTSIISMKYSRLWEEGVEPAETFSLTVVVK